MPVSIAVTVLPIADESLAIPETMSAEAPESAPDAPVVLITDRLSADIDISLCADPIIPTADTKSIAETASDSGIGKVLVASSASLAEPASTIEAAEGNCTEASVSAAVAESVTDEDVILIDDCASIPLAVSDTDDTAALIADMVSDDMPASTDEVIVAPAELDESIAEPASTIEAAEGNCTEASVSAAVAESVTDEDVILIDDCASIPLAVSDTDDTAALIADMVSDDMPASTDEVIVAPAELDESIAEPASSSLHPGARPTVTLSRVAGNGCGFV